MAATLQVDETTGAEIRIETGTGHIEKLNHGERNVQVVVRSDNAKMRMPVTGWADGNDDALVQALEAAEASGARIAYRIVVHRKGNVSATIPLAAVGNMDKVRDFVSFTLETSGAPPAGDSHTAHAETMDQRFNGGSDTEPGTADVEDYERQVAGEPARREPTPADTTGPDASGPQVGDTKPAAKGPKVQEEKPWEAFNSDGSLNPGSYAFDSAQRAVAHAGRLYRMYLKDAAFEDDAPDPHAAPDVGRMRVVAGYLLNCAEQAQAAVRQDGHHDRMAASFTRALHAVIDASYVYPPPFAARGDVDAIKAWRDDLAGYAAAMMHAAADLTRKALG